VLYYLCTRHAMPMAGIIGAPALAALSGMHLPATWHIMFEVIQIVNTKDQSHR